MNETKYLIIGGGIAGTTAAETIRQNDAEGSIAIISDEPYPLYSRIMLSKPNFFLEKVPFDRVWLKPEDWYKQQKINLELGKKASSLNVNEKTVTLDSGDVYKYEKLLLALGGEVRKLDISGSEKKNVFYLRTLDDAKGIINAVKSSKKAIVIGGGFVGFEMCDMLKMAKLDVDLVIREKNFWENALDIKTSQMIEDEMKKAGVNIIRESEVSEIAGDNTVKGIKLSSGETIECDLVIIGIGVCCPFEWITKAGLEVNKGIIANEYLETTCADVWTAGDSAEFKDLILDEQVQLGNWVNAQMHGVIAGKNMTGQKEAYKMATSYTTHGFDMIISFIGDARTLPDRQIINRAKANGKSYSRIFVINDEIVGATIVNDPKELGDITRLINNNIKVSDKINELTNPETDLKTLL